MPYIETPDELAEKIADYANVYSRNGCECGCAAEGGGDHDESCICRLCFVGDIEKRIRQSARNEKILMLVALDRGSKEE